MSSAPSPLDETNSEICSLIEVLHQTGQRLELLTAGEVDTVSDRLGRAFLLQRAQETLRHGEADRQAALLDALPAHIALLDSQGMILSVNEAWRTFAGAGAFHGPGYGVGCNYLAVCDITRAESFHTARQAAGGIRSVLSGAVPLFSIDYSCHSLVEPRWFRFTVTPLSGTPPNGAVVTHLEVTAERRTQESLRVSESRFRQMAESIRDVFFLRSSDGSRVYYVSPAYEEIWGRSCESLYAAPTSWTDSMHPEDRVAALRKFGDRHSPGFDCEYRIIRPDGTVRWIHVRGFAILDDSGNAYRTAGVATDITARKEIEDKVKRLNRVHAVLSGINALIVRVADRDALFRETCRIAVEAGAFRMAWVGASGPQSPDENVVAWFGEERSYIDSLAPTRRAGTPADIDRPATRALLQLQPVICNDIETDPGLGDLRSDLLGRGHKSAGFFPLTVAGKPCAVLALFAGEVGFFDGEETLLLQELAGNISFALDHLEKVARLNYVAYYDVLTGLANRQLFLERVTQSIRSASSGGHKLALCVLDLERFKNINDTFGRAAADALLTQMAEWLTQNFGDASLLARVGADQFAAVLPEVTHEEAVARLLEKTMRVFLDHPFQFDDKTFRVAAKVGVALFPDDGASADALFRNAEAALKKAKANGDRYLFYAHRMTETVAGRLVLDYRLRHALDNDEFVLHYQPKVSLTTHEVTGAEALIRWNDPKTGLVPPARFIPILEETGLIFEVGRWALRKAVEESLRWRKAGLPCGRIAVNVSPLQLRNRGFVNEINDAIAGDMNAAAGLELEITESLIMEDVKHTKDMLRAIRAMGVTIAIDDFGTGFSSLSYLARLPADTLKIDRSFVTEMTSGPEGAALVSTIISLGHSLNLKVVAEGVETREQAERLRSNGCDEMQGFLFSKAVPAELFETRFLTAPAAAH